MATRKKSDLNADLDFARLRNIKFEVLTKIHPYFKRIKKDGVAMVGAKTLLRVPSQTHRGVSENYLYDGKGRALGMMGHMELK